MGNPDLTIIIERESGQYNFVRIQGNEYDSEIDAVNMACKIYKDNQDSMLAEKMSFDNSPIKLITILKHNYEI